MPDLPRPKKEPYKFPSDDARVGLRGDFGGGKASEPANSSAPQRSSKEYGISAAIRKRRASYGAPK